MSELLRLREWVGYADALRYMSLLGIKGATKEDLFSTYTSADMPMRLVCQDEFPLFTLSVAPGGEYPTNLSLLDELPPLNELFLLGKTRCTYETDSGTLHPIDPELIVAPRERQRSYGENGIAWVYVPRSLELERPEVEPIYYQDGDSSLLQLSWGGLMMDWAEGTLQFSRPHIETLVNRALGKGSDAPAQAIEPVNYTTRLLQIQSEAIQKWWENYDPAQSDTAPAQKKILNWLTAEKGCTQQAAEAIDLIIRHDSRKKGGAKPKG